VASNKFYYLSSPTEELFGGAYFGADWEGPQSDDERAALQDIRIAPEWVSLDGERDGPPHYEPRGPIATRTYDRALKRRALLGEIQRLLQLLKDKGERFDPLEDVPAGDVEKLERIRDIYWFLKNFSQSGDNGCKRFLAWNVVAAQTGDRWLCNNGFPPGDDIEIRQLRRVMNGAPLLNGVRPPLALIATEVPAIAAPAEAAAASAGAHLDEAIGPPLPNAKHNGFKSSRAAYHQCLKWLSDEMIKSLTDRPQPKALYLKEAQKLFSGLSERSFDSAWQEAIRITGSLWDKHGRPKGLRNEKTPH
jgi:hypothetical protein